MLPKVPLSYTDDQREFLAALRKVAADALILGNDVSADWEVLDTRPATGPRGEARYASYTIQSKDYVRQAAGRTPVRILFRGSAIAGPSSVLVNEYQLIPHPFFTEQYNSELWQAPAIIDQFTE
jgi:hypothetical protein